MTNANKPDESPVKLATRTFTIRSFVCETGGGFERIHWLIKVNDGFLRLDQARKRKIPNYAVSILGEDDPNGLADHDHQSHPAGVWYTREYEATVPEGTIFRWVRDWPDRERARREPFSIGVPISTERADFILRRTGFLEPYFEASGQPQPAPALQLAPAQTIEALHDILTALEQVKQ